MFYFSALIYNGYHQQIVTGSFDDEGQFMRYLDDRFGVYVCLWHDQCLASEQNK